MVNNYVKAILTLQGVQAYVLFTFENIYYFMTDIDYL